jgi:CHAD domain-containing protein
MAKARDIPGLELDMPFGEAARAAVAVRARELFEHADGVLDTEDIERVHDMRVATRRLRAVLEVFAAAFDKDRHKDVLRDVKALADALGARRDPDVHLEALLALEDVMPEADQPGLDVFAQRLRVEQAQGNQILARALEHVRESDLEGRLRALLAGPGDDGAENAVAGDAVEEPA